MSRVKNDKVVRVDSSLFDAIKGLTQEEVFFDSEGGAKRVHNPMPSAFSNLSDKQMISLYFYTILKMTYSTDDFNMFLIQNPPNFDKYLIDVLEQKLSPNQSVIVPASKINDMLELQLELNKSIIDFRDYQVKENRSHRLFMIRNFQFIKRGLTTLIGTIMESFNLSDRKVYLNDKSMDAYNVLSDFGDAAASQVINKSESSEE